MIGWIHLGWICGYIIQVTQFHVFFSFQVAQIEYVICVRRKRA